MKIALVGYRDWALKIYDNLAENLLHEFLRINTKEDYSEETLRDFHPDYILFYGWSWIISSSLINDYKCIMLHPSPLPSYRGGSPIQNQIVRGEIYSAVTLFLMDQGIDTGPIIRQESISLEGSLQEIFNRITSTGTELTIDFLKNGLNLMPQDHSKATSFKRRKESDSEITLEEIATKDANYLFNKIRMLQDPYPKPYIKTSDGAKLIILNAEIEK